MSSNCRSNCINDTAEIRDGLAGTPSLYVVKTPRLELFVDQIIQSNDSMSPGYADAANPHGVHTGGHQSKDMGNTRACSSNPRVVPFICICAW